jgi:very-long-chain enoyl-CoA reductase
MLMFHYLKREIESMFVHRFSSATMPAMRVVYNSLFYWGLSGILVGYFLFHPNYVPQTHFSLDVQFGLIACFFSFETLNGCAHLILRNLRPSGTKTRGIPNGVGFGFVSCVNYTYEVLSWFIFALFVHTIPGYIFVGCTIYVLRKWAMERHLRYKKEFDGLEGRPLYPKNRTALIPFLY